MACSFLKTKSMVSAAGLTSRLCKSHKPQRSWSGDDRTPTLETGSLQDTDASLFLGGGQLWLCVHGKRNGIMAHGCCCSVRKPAPVCSCRPARRRPSLPAACTCPAIEPETHLQDMDAFLSCTRLCKPSNACHGDSLDIQNERRGSRTTLLILKSRGSSLPTCAARTHLQRACRLDNGGCDRALADRQLKLLEVRRNLAARQVARRQHVLCSSHCGSSASRCKCTVVDMQRCSRGALLCHQICFISQGLKLRFRHTWRQGEDGAEHVGEDRADDEPLLGTLHRLHSQGRDINVALLLLMLLITALAMAKI